MRQGAEVYQKLKTLAKKKYGQSAGNVGDEGGVAPDIQTPEEALDLITEAIEAAVKLARQYFLEKSPPEPQRTRFVARRQSYHGSTLGALAVGGHATRRAPFTPLLADGGSLVSPCHPYRNRGAAESDAEYVRRLADELDAEFVRVGADTVCAFIAEPVVGAVRRPLHSWLA